MRKRVLKGGKKKASKSIKRIPDVDELWAKYSRDQFSVVSTPTEQAIGLGPKAQILAEIEKHPAGLELVAKAKEARAAIEKVNKTCETSEERFVVLERKYEPARTI